MSGILRNILFDRTQIIAAVASFEHPSRALRWLARKETIYVWHMNQCESRSGFSKTASWAINFPSHLRKHTFLFFLLALTICIHNAGLFIRASACLSTDPTIKRIIADLYIPLDLKLENILMTFENDSILPNFIKEHTTNLSMEYKPESTTGRNIYRCHNNFGPLDWRELKRMVHKITDFGMGARLDSGKGEFGINPIQPDHYRAPEVIVGCGWDSSADIWNFGVLVRYMYSVSAVANSSPRQVWDIIGSTGLFRQVHDAHGRYDAKAHLAEMIALLGTPPKELLAKSQAMVQQKWPEPIESEADRLCWNAQEFFDGPFFNTDGTGSICMVLASANLPCLGEFLHSNLISSRSLETAVPSLEDKERETFLSFVRCMLAWIPGKRKTARELIEHPFLNLKGR